MQHSDRIAIYIRLSSDDGTASESNSITNQRELLKHYIANDTHLSFCEMIEYCDDGYSGTNFNRPSVSKLLQDVKSGKIGCILVKDFSRFGRNYIEVGTYLEQVFPFLNVRFISVNDRYDSSNQDATLENIEVALKTLISDLYSKDLSTKVKSGLDAKKKRGEYASGLAPYGYKKSATNKNKLEIDEGKAEIVQLIFSLAAEGKRRTDIAKILNSEGIPTRSGKSRFWKRCDISDILLNECYTGKIIANKRKQQSVGGRQIPNPRGQWTIIPNTHPAIVSEEVFRQANKKSMGTSVSNPKTTIQPNMYPLKGKVFCKHCGYALCRKGKKKVGYLCETPLSTESKSCVPKAVPESVIKEAVLSVLQSQFLLYLDLEKKYKLSNVREKNSKNSLPEDLYKTLKNLSAKKHTLYEDYSDGTITKTDYLLQKKDINSQIQVLTDKIAAIENFGAYSEVAKPLPAEVKIDVEHFLNIKTLTRALVDAFVERVVVDADGNVEVVLRYRGMGAKNN